MSVIVDQIVVSDKFKHGDDGFKYFIGYQENDIIIFLKAIEKKTCLFLLGMIIY